MGEEPKNENKPEFKGNLGFIWLIGILVILLGCTVVYTLKITKENKELKQTPPEPPVVSTTQEQAREDNSNVDTTSETKENTKNENSKELAIKTLKKYLLDETWVKDNLYITKDLTEKNTKKTTKQILAFKVVNDTKSEIPAVCIKTELKDGIGTNLYLLTYENKNVKVISITEGVCHPDHNMLLANDNSIAVEYAHMGYWNYSIYNVTNGKLVKETTDKGELKDEEDDYTELNSVTGKYNLKEIKTTLNKVNLEKYLK